MHAPIVQSRIEARPKPRVNLPGCVLALQEDETGYDIVLVDGDRTTRLVRLPWNVEEDAIIWRGLIEEKLRP
jgi:hypothetical protein